MTSTPQQVLERLCAERGENFASLSRLIGRNDAYIQQFLRKGTPRQLKERERRTLARYFQIPESMLGGLPDDVEAEYGELVPIVRVAVRASAGPGAIPGAESTRPAFAFDQRWPTDAVAAQGLWRWRIPCAAGLGNRPPQELTLRRSGGPPK